MKITYPYSSGTLSTTTQIIPTEGCGIPCTIMLKSSSTTRLIEISFDSLEWFTPVLDYISATTISVSIGSPINNIRLTGAINDSWKVLQ